MAIAMKRGTLFSSIRNQDHFMNDTTSQGSAL